MAAEADRRICRSRAPIEAYGKGGFRFAGMSHRGSLLCLPGGIWAWPVARAGRDQRGGAGAGVRRAGDIELFLLGTGNGAWLMPEPLRWRFRALGIGSR